MDDELLPPEVEEGEILPPIVRIGDAFELVKTLKDESIQMFCCSPPYWSLRKYLPDDSPLKPKEIGQESTPEEYISRLGDLFELIWYKLKKDGAGYIVIGDTYLGSAQAKKGTWRKPKQAALIPCRLAIELQNRGYWVYNEIRWVKVNPLCECVRHRYARATETILYVGKSADPYFDIDAVKEPIAESTLKRFIFAMRKEKGFLHAVYDDDKETKTLKALRDPDSLVGYPKHVTKAFEEFWRDMECTLYGGTKQLTLTGEFSGDKEFELENKKLDKWKKLKEITGGRIQHGWYKDGYKGIEQKSILRNPRDVFVFPTKSFHGMHYATYPPELIVKPILASSRLGDWVLDPFAGTGTTGEVAQKLGRNCILFELNPEYEEIIKKRCLLNIKRISDYINRGG